MKRDDFPNRKHVALPVIHVQNENQAIANVAIAQERGCDGVFLINHQIDCYELMDIYREIRKFFPDWWIGLNLLDVLPEKVFGIIPSDVSAIWTDNAMIESHTRDQPYADLISKVRKKSGWKGMYFGGVAFKYQAPVHNIEKVTEIAMHYMDVITTSGTKTGSPPDPEKIRRMKEVVQDVAPLAIASGIRAENVHLYPGCKFFLIATSISRDFYNLDPNLMEDLVSAIR